MSDLFLLIAIICFLCIPVFIVWAVINIIRKRPAKKYFKLSGLSALLLVISFIIYGFTSDSESTTTNNTAKSTIQSNTNKPVNQESPISPPDSLQNQKQEENETGTEQMQTEKPVVIKSGSYDIAGETFQFSDSVINDITGKWRLSLIASSKDTTEYAIDYYNTLFNSNDEIHAIVNFSKNTTTKISVLYDGMLDVTVYEYVDKEEHDANILFSGMLLKEYFINIETGDIEEISTTSEEPFISEIETTIIEEQPKTEENNDVTEISTQNNFTNSNNNFNTYNNVSQQQTSDSYVLNSGTYKFHYPSCDSVAQIAPQNYSTSNSSRSEIMAQGYKPCGRCNP